MLVRECHAPLADKLSQLTTNPVSDNRPPDLLAHGKPHPTLRALGAQRQNDQMPPLGAATLRLHVEEVGPLPKRSQGSVAPCGHSETTLISMQSLQRDAYGPWRGDDAAHDVRPWSPSAHGIRALSYDAGCSAGRCASSIQSSFDSFDTPPNAGRGKYRVNTICQDQINRASPIRANNQWRQRNRQGFVPRPGASRKYFASKTKETRGTPTGRETRRKNSLDRAGVQGLRLSVRFRRTQFGSAQGTGLPRVFEFLPAAGSFWDVSRGACITARGACGITFHPQSFNASSRQLQSTLSTGPCGQACG